MIENGEIIRNNSDRKYMDNLKNPFQSDCVTTINIEIGKPFFETEVTCVATVRFKNGNTRGSQKLENKNFTELVKEIESFIQSLNQTK
jgi:hypothetical protein